MGSEKFHETLQRLLQIRGWKSEDLFEAMVLKVGTYMPAERVNGLVRGTDQPHTPSEVRVIADALEVPRSVLFESTHWFFEYVREVFLETWRSLKSKPCSEAEAWNAVEQTVEFRSQVAGGIKENIALAIEGLREESALAISMECPKCGGWVVGTRCSGECGENYLPAGW